MLTLFASVLFGGADVGGWCFEDITPECLHSDTCFLHALDDLLFDGDTSGKDRSVEIDSGEVKFLASGEEQIGNGSA